VRKYDADGNELWTRQFGTAGVDSASGVAADASGLYVAALTSGTFPDQTSAGGTDAFVAKIVDTIPPAPVGSGARVAGLPAGLALTPEQLAPVMAGPARWQAAGVITAQLDALRRLPVQMAHLPDGTLGSSTAAGILISPDAGGYGGFVDPTPWADEAFGLAAGPDLGRRDLLSVVDRIGAERLLWFSLDFARGPTR
jgi:hypothetical protein